MWHRHRWALWGELKEGTLRTYPSQLETMLGRNWAGVSSAGVIETTIHIQSRRCETCGKIEIRQVA